MFNQFNKKIIINRDYGGFSINPSIIRRYGFDEESKDIRTNETLIKLIESGVDCNDNYSYLVVVEIPSNATDYKITDYDGYETVLYVVDGKIYEV